MARWFTTGTVSSASIIAMPWDMCSSVAASAWREVEDRARLTLHHQADNDDRRGENDAGRNVEPQVALISGEHIVGCQSDRDQQRIPLQPAEADDTVDLVDFADRPETAAGGAAQHPFALAAAI